ncbi:hypothetical protein D3C86_756630 [compost metagenome]
MAREEQDRHAVALFDPARHDSRDAVMEALIRQDHEGLAVEVPFSLQAIADFLLQLGVQLLALHVDGVQVAGEAVGLGLVVGREQLEPDIRGLQPARGVEARPEAEADVLGGEGVEVGLGDRPQRLDAREGAPRPVAVALAVALDSRPDQRAVWAVQGHHVGHRPDGHEVQEMLHARGVRAFHRDGQEVGHAHSREILEVVEIHLWVDDGVHVRKLFGHLVVIRHDQVDAVGLGRRGRRMGRDPVVASQDDTGALGGEPLDGGWGDAVTVLEAIGEVGLDVSLEATREVAVEDRRGGHAVAVVIPVDDDLLAGGQGLLEAANGLLHAGREDGMLEVIERVA